jgi:hypothetical protein
MRFGFRVRVVLRDMQDHISFGALLRDRLGWAEPPSSLPSEERRAFGRACEVYEEARESREMGELTRARLPAGLVRARSEGADPGVPTMNIPSMRELEPSQRLSRTVRAFCAWKAVR